MNIEGYKVGMAQILVEGGRPQANLDRAVSMVRQAADRGCRLVVLPECLDLGWTDPSARELAQPIPGPHAERLAQAAREHRVHVAAGLVERAGDRLYNAAVLFGPSGEILLPHRKVNELDIALDLYSVGDRLGVVETELGTIGLNVCADNFADSLAVGLDRVAGVRLDDDAVTSRIRAKERIGQFEYSLQWRHWADDDGLVERRAVRPPAVEHDALVLDPPPAGGVA